MYVLGLPNVGAGLGSGCVVVEVPEMRAGVRPWTNNAWRLSDERLARSGRVADWCGLAWLVAAHNNGGEAPFKENYA